jgi:cytidine deaminase
LEPLIITDKRLLRGRRRTGAFTLGNLEHLLHVTMQARVEKGSHYKGYLVGALGVFKVDSTPIILTAGNRKEAPGGERYCAERLLDEQAREEGKGYFEAVFICAERRPEKDPLDKILGVRSPCWSCFDLIGRSQHFNSRTVFILFEPFEGKMPNSLVWRSYGELRKLNKHQHKSNRH